MTDQRKYQPGDKVYRARVGTLFDGVKPRLYAGEATVESCGAQMVGLRREDIIGDNGWALGFSNRPAVSSVYPTKLAALQALEAEAAAEVKASEQALEKRRAELVEVRSHRAVEERCVFERMSKLERYSDEHRSVCDIPGCLCGARKP
jgi:hypothetical protein